MCIESNKCVRVGGRVVENRLLLGRTWRIVLEVPAMEPGKAAGKTGTGTPFVPVPAFPVYSVGEAAFALPEPGQFCMVQVDEGLVPFLPRPLSISDAEVVGTGSDQRIRLSFCYQVRGRGTALLCAVKVGASLKLLGPLGRGFVVNPDTREHLLIAGGIGAAPMPLLARRIAEAGGSLSFLVGARTADDVVLTDELAALGARVEVSTDDGSRGTRGTVLHLVERFLKEKAPAEAAAYLCGPEPMLKAVGLYLFEHGVSAQASLEAHMACGIGACQGCVVKVKMNTSAERYVRVCKEGPVFDVKEIW